LIFVVGLFAGYPAIAEDAAPISSEKVLASSATRAIQGTDVRATKSRPVENKASSARSSSTEQEAVAQSRDLQAGKGSSEEPDKQGQKTEACGSGALGESKGFGYAAFHSEGEPITDGPVDDGYLISPGDEIVVSIWGQLVETMNLTVTDEGFIELPEQGGRIQTNGLSLKDLRQKIVQALSLIYAAYIDPVDISKSKAFVDIRLGKLRQLSIFVVGEVNKPGAYTIGPGVANVINLLHNACGVTDKGTLRMVKVRRANGKSDTIDLYGFLLTGDIDTRTIRLGPGDSIHVPVKEKSVTIEGEVKRPNTYEMVGDEGMRDLVKFAGGFTPDAYLKHVQAHRYEENRGEILMDLDLDVLHSQPSANLPLLNGDRLVIPKNIQVRNNSVTIQGDGITRVGTYEWTQGMTLNDLIEKAEGLREYAYLGRADLIRTESDFSRRLSILSLEDLYKRDSDGKIVFTGNAEKNIPLKEMDEVIVQSTPGMSGASQFVMLEGSVKHPGKYDLTKDMRLYDLIFARGGFQDDAIKKATFLDKAHIFRTRPGMLGKKIISFNLGDLLSGQASANLALEENDVIRIYSYDEIRQPKKVIIDGFVKKPGDYAMVEGLTLEDLILMAGGVIPQGSVLEAAIARREAEEDAKNRLGQAELLHVPIDPKNVLELPVEQRTVLEDGDYVTIRTPLGWKNTEVAWVGGQVNASGNYTISPGAERLSSIINRAGGLSDEALLEGAFIRRRMGVVGLAGTKVNNYRGVTMNSSAALGNSGGPDDYHEVIVNLPAALANPGSPDDIIIQSEDKVFIPRNPGVVQVRGAVNRELTLQHKSDRTLDEYIALCGGYMAKADPVGTKIYGPNKAALTPSQGKGKNQKSTPIPPGSVIEVPFLHQNERLLTVEVKGAVTKPALIQHIEGAPLGYYLNLADGFIPEADIAAISVLMPDGSLLRKQGDKPFNPIIKGGSQIMVPTSSTSSAKQQ